MVKLAFLKAPAVGVVLWSSLFAASTVLAADPPLQMSYPTDAGLTCEGLTAEMARMDSIMGVSQTAIGAAEGQATAVNAAASAGINAALYSGALGKVPGLGMFGNAAAAAAKRNAAAKAKAQGEVIQTAQARKTLLTGIYQGKNCAAAAVAAAPAPVAGAVTPVVAPVR